MKVINLKSKKAEKDDNSDVRRIFYCSASISAVLMIITLAFAVHDSTELTLENLVANFPEACSFLLMCLLTSAIFFAFAYLLLFLINKGVVGTAIHLLGRKISNNRLIKNSNIISYYIRPFLFEVLKHNNSVLNLKLGQDISSLVYEGYVTRNDCVFYRFSTVTDCPNFENEDLRKILQKLIVSELECYGIAYLLPIYKSITAQYYSVYLDRVFYDESTHTLVFDLLYVCTESSARYFEKAIARDNQPTQAERTVFDDEL